MPGLTLHELFKAGVHFGHQKRFWCPKMDPYVYGTRNSIHIIDLEKTLPMLRDALHFVSSVVAANGVVLFVGTKKNASEHVRNQALRCGMPYVSKRWLGGMLTNFKTIKQSINRLKELESQSVNGTFDRLTKKEALMRTREMEKLERNLGGIKQMEGMPDAIFVIDVRHERIAISEAAALPNPIPVIAVVDTNSSPDKVACVIPGNDDSSKANAYFTTLMADTILSSRARREDLSDQEVMIPIENGAATEAIADDPETAEVVGVSVTQTGDEPLSGDDSTPQPAPSEATDAAIEPQDDAPPGTVVAAAEEKE